VVVDIATVQQGVNGTNGVGHGAGDAEDLAPGIIGVLNHAIAVGIQNRNDVALQIRHIVVPGASEYCRDATQGTSIPQVAFVGKLSFFLFA